MTSHVLRAAIAIALLWWGEMGVGVGGGQVVLSANSFRQLLRSAEIVPSGRSLEVSDIYIRYYGMNSSQPSSYHIGDVSRLLADPGFFPDQPHVVYIHGYLEMWTDESVQTVVRAYRARGGWGVIVLDWANLGYGNYLAAATNVPRTGLSLGRAVRRLVRGGLRLGDVHVVGHSLGAHIAHTAGDYLRTRMLLLSRITALDAAWPGAYPPLLTPALSPRVAAFVDALHTSPAPGGYGAPQRLAHADFYPNPNPERGVQPGCPTNTLFLTVEDLCSHWRSWQLWAASVRGERFPAQRCGGRSKWLRGSCGGTHRALMGIDVDTKSRGAFYLRTAAAPPYSLGDAGAAPPVPPRPTPTPSDLQ